MTRINSAINVTLLSDEHLLAEHREIKRLPACYEKSLKSGSIKRIPRNFCLGAGHVTFFFDKGLFTLKRYIELRNECIRRNFNVTDYSNNWNVYNKQHFLDYEVTTTEKKLLINRIRDNILNSNKQSFHYYGAALSKTKIIELLETND